MRIILLMVMLFISYANAQHPVLVEAWTRHGIQMTKAFHVSSDKPDSIVVQFPGSLNREGRIDTLITGATISSVWVNSATRGDIMWNGYFRIQFSLANTNLATDSLEHKVYALDKDGDVIQNDYVYGDFGTPPSWDNDQTILSWTTALSYIADLSGAFGEGVGGALIIVNPNDATASHGGMEIMKVTVK